MINPTYNLTKASKNDSWKSAKEFYSYIRNDSRQLYIAMFFVALNSIAGVVSPIIIARAVDNYIARADLHGLVGELVLLAVIFVATIFFGYAQGRMVGTVSQRTLFRVRNALFDKLQELPIAFFNQNKAGDLMSRINNDTDKLNQFLGESIARFVGIFFAIFGIGVLVLVLNWKLGLALLAPTLGLIIMTKLSAKWVEKINKRSLVATGSLTASLQENLTNFRVIVAFNKREYFKNHIKTVNTEVFDSTMISGAVTSAFSPIYDFAGAAALIITIGYGLHLVSISSLTIGLLVAYVSYVQKFYDPIRTLAQIFSAIQLSLASWSRIREILNLQSDLPVLKVEDLSKNTLDAKNPADPTDSPSTMEIRDVSFGYVADRMVVENVNMNIRPGKTYALVGPTGGGKSTLASLMTRLYDPVSGSITLSGRDIRTYSSAERAGLVSVILQEPLLFTGTVAENITYGNDKLFASHDNPDIEALLKEKGFAEVISRFSDGLSTKVTQTGTGLSLGQKQLISFMRAVLREPKILILDEATANIDTVTEAILTKALKALSPQTSKIIIAHRLNTIKDADEIMFVNGHHVTKAENFHEAVSLIESAKRVS